MKEGRILTVADLTHFTFLEPGRVVSPIRTIMRVISTMYS